MPNRLKNNKFPRPCTKCKIPKEESEFSHRTSVTGKKYFRSWCNECLVADHRERYKYDLLTDEQRRKKLDSNAKYRRDAKEKGICTSCLTTPRSATSQYCHRCRERVNEQRIERVAEFKKQIFDHYGHRCACSGCNETLEEFLTIDHVGGWGKNHRDEKGFRIGGERLYREIIKAGFPDTFRILCFNCNCSQAFRGYCPHEVAVLVQ